MFFELADCIAGPQGKYFAAYSYTPDNPNQSLYSIKYAELIRNSNRVWIEGNNGIKFIKHRYGNPEHIKVNMKEFFWIKLKSIAV